ncbi:MAG: DCC1-like thiol-disulfide oxidoreductase family protein, partial [Bradymonadaceae bacterium]
MPHRPRHRRSDLERPLVVWDGDCPFCLASIRLLRRLVGEAVDSAPYQRVHERFPTLGADAFAESVYLLEPDGRSFRGAEAIFRALDRADSRVLALGRRLYERSRWFAR